MLYVTDSASGWRLNSCGLHFYSSTKIRKKKIELLVHCPKWLSEFPNSWMMNKNLGCADREKMSNGWPFFLLNGSSKWATGWGWRTNQKFTKIDKLSFHGPLRLRPNFTCRHQATRLMQYSSSAGNRSFEIFLIDAVIGQPTPFTQRTPPQIAGPRVYENHWFPLTLINHCFWGGVILAGRSTGLWLICPVFFGWFPLEKRRCESELSNFGSRGLGRVWYDLFWQMVRSSKNNWLVGGEMFCCGFSDWTK